MLIALLISLGLNGLLMLRLVHGPFITPQIDPGPSPDDRWQVVIHHCAPQGYTHIDIEDRFVVTDGKTVFKSKGMSPTSEQWALKKAREMNRNSNHGRSYPRMQDFKKDLVRREYAERQAQDELERAARQFEQELRT